MKVTNNPTASRTTQSDNSALVDYLEVLVTKRWMIVVTVVIFVLLSVAYGMVSKPVYQADMLVQVDDANGTGGGGGGGGNLNVVSQVSNLFNTKSPTTAEVQILDSRRVVSAAVDDLKMYITAGPKRFPLIGNWIAGRSSELSKPGLFGFGGFGWGSENVQVDAFDTPPEYYGEPYTLTALGNNSYRLKGPGVEGAQGQVGKSLIVTTVEGPLRLMVNALSGNPGAAFEVTRNSRLRSISSVQNQLQVLELQKPSGVIQVTYPSSNAQSAADILSTIGKAYVAQNIDRGTEDAQKSLLFLNEQLPIARKRLEKAEDNYSELRRSRGTVDLSDESRLVLQQGVDLQTQLVTLVQKRQELALRFAPSHPSIRAIDEQIATLQGQISKVESKVNQLPSLQQDVVRLQREVAVNTTLYTGLLVSVQQLQLAKAGQVGSVRIVDTPVVPEVPIRPKKALIVIISAFVGLFVGVSLAFVLDVLLSGVTDPNELEERTGLNVFATVPESTDQHSLYGRIISHQRGNFLLASNHPDDPAIESLRSLRVAMQLALHDAKSNVLLFTGPAPGVGKSFVSANFASVMGASGKKVLLIDGDMRKGYLNQYFNTGRENGLVDLLRGDVSFETVLRKEVASNVDLITSGIYPKNPSELLAGDRLANLVSFVSGIYDVVILDAPPVLPVSDSGMIALLAGVVLLVARSGVTRPGEVAESAKRLAAAGGIVTGTVFNGVTPMLGRLGYKYGGYRYTAYKYESDDK